MTNREELAALTSAVRRTVAEKRSRYLSGKGTSPTSNKPPERLTSLPPAAAAPTNVLDAFVDDPSLSKSDRLVRLQNHIGDCQRCPLGASRIRLAFGVGNPDAKVVFIGEGPGYAEDRQGEPFVGPAGQLLDKILTATGLSRGPVNPPVNWVFIANMVKCHPMIDPSDNTKRSNDRPPTPEEMDVCSPFLFAQLRIIQPLFLVTLGNTAGRALLKTEEGISKFRGRWVDFRIDGLTARLLPTYHPAALLRNPSLKKDVWEDMKSLRAELDK